MVRLFTRYAMLFAIILLLACERPVDLKIDDIPARLVVLSKFTHDESLRLRLSQTRSVLDSEEPSVVRNARVDLYEGEQFVGPLEFVVDDGNSQNSYYTSKHFKPKQGKAYTLKAVAPGFAEVQATDAIPAAVPIRSLHIEQVETMPGSRPGEVIYAYQVTFSFVDPGAQENYYHLNFYQQVLGYNLLLQDTLITSNWLQRIEFSPENDNNSFIAYFEGGILFDDKPFDGRIVTYSFPLRTTIQPQRMLLGKMFAELRSVSKSYYLFSSSLSRQRNSPGGPLSEPVIVFSNIENGSGVFAAYSQTVDSVAVLW